MASLKASSAKRFLNCKSTDWLKPSITAGFMSAVSIRSGCSRAFLVRELHEGLAARICCERATRAEIRELTDLVHNIYAKGAAGDVDAMATLDRDLHARLIRMSGNSMLIRLADNYRILGKIVRADRNIEGRPR